jgi:hypothetical protein
MEVSQFFYISCPRVCRLPQKKAKLSTSEEFFLRTFKYIRV